jgi:6-phosphogluconate dehydrogenase
MKIGFIGLGRMGKNMVLNLKDNRQSAVLFNRSPEVTKKLSRRGLMGAYSIEELLSKLPKRKVVWVMIKAGNPVDAMIKKLSDKMNKGDVIIDGGNSYYKDSIRRAKGLKKKGIYYMDVGTSGGIEGAREGACMMIGGDRRAFNYCEGIFRAMCVQNGYGYMGKSGAGHFVKMVHNGIEYGMVGALAEGMEAVRKHSGKFGTNVKEVAKVYSHGSIIEGRLTGWMWDAFQKKGYLNSISCEVPKGETEDEMKELEKIAKMKVLHEARMMRVDTRHRKFCGTLISALRNEWGGHKTKKK